MVGDCRVSQVVDGRKGVHCMIPKDIFKGPRKEKAAATQ
jgi:acetamidase/formamidase